MKILSIIGILLFSIFTSMYCQIIVIHITSQLSLLCIVWIIIVILCIIWKYLSGLNIYLYTFGIVCSLLSYLYHYWKNMFTFGLYFLFLTFNYISVSYSLQSCNLIFAFLYFVIFLYSLCICNFTIFSYSNSGLKSNVNRK